MTDAALALAFELACKGRDRAEAKVKELEETIAVLCQELSDLRFDKSQLTARLRVVELMEEQAANRLGFQIPLRPVEAHSLKVVQ